MAGWRLARGAQLLDSASDRAAAEFAVWAPHADTVEVELAPGSERAVCFPLKRQADGVFSAVRPAVAAGDTYFFIIDGRRRVPDPCSRFQPRGLSGPSEVIDEQSYRWGDAGWSGIAVDELIIYELHVGAFTAAGTYSAAAQLLPSLRELGVTAIELMPLAQCPGTRNWGYDGVLHYSPQHSYGRPEELKQLIDAAHQAGLAVLLDVVYNHFGPEGNFFDELGPYTSSANTPWGPAINFDGRGGAGKGDRSFAEVRRYFSENARYWVHEYHIDGFRLDAVQAIVDSSAEHIAAEIARAVCAEGRALGRQVVVIAEDERQDGAALKPQLRGRRQRTAKAQSGSSLDCDAAWNNFFHYALHSRLTGERNSFYADFGGVDELAAVLRSGSAPCRRRAEAYGLPVFTDVSTVAPRGWICYGQNHDLVGNRGDGKRLAALVGFEDLKLAAGLLIISPFTPLFFMGEEYGERNPFFYFTDFADADLSRRVEAGRQNDFRLHGWAAACPDAASTAAFVRSKLSNWSALAEEQSALRRFYRDAIALRKRYSKLLSHYPQVSAEKAVLLLSAVWRDDSGAQQLAVLGNFSNRPAVQRLEAPAVEGAGRSLEILLDSSAELYAAAEGSAERCRLREQGAGLELELPAKSFVCLGTT